MSTCECHRPVRTKRFSSSTSPTSVMVTGLPRELTWGNEVKALANFSRGVIYSPAACRTRVGPTTRSSSRCVGAEPRVNPMNQAMKVTARLLTRASRPKPIVTGVPRSTTTTWCDGALAAFERSRHIVRLTTTRRTSPGSSLRDTSRGMDPQRRMAV